MKTSEVIANAGMRVVTKGRNLFRVGWHGGYFVAEFRRGDALWLYGPNVPEVKRDQVLANPYPDSLFEKAIKSKFKAFKVQRAECEHCDQSGCTHCGKGLG